MAKFNHKITSEDGFLCTSFKLWVNSECVRNLAFGNFCAYGKLLVTMSEYLFQGWIFPSTGSLLTPPKLTVMVGENSMITWPIWLVCLFWRNRKVSSSPAHPSDAFVQSGLAHWHLFIHSGVDSLTRNGLIIKYSFWVSFSTNQHSYTFILGKFLDKSALW